MSRKKGFLLAACAAVIIAIIAFLMQPAFMVRAGHELVCAKLARPGMPFTIHFIHSVQKTPVEEYLVVNDTVDGFILQSTKYQSFGVGLPFLAGEGNFREEGDYFIFDNMDRHFSTLSLRPGVGTELTLTVDGTEYRLFELFSLGQRIDLSIAPYYTRFLN